jgi:hypothetical protein
MNAPKLQRTLAVALALALAGASVAQSNAPAAPADLAAKRAEMARLQQEMSELGKRMASMDPTHALEWIRSLPMVGEPLAPRHEQSKKPDTLQAWAPQDSISHAEAMLAHTERKMANLKLLLDLPEQNPDRPGPWAA